MYFAKLSICIRFILTVIWPHRRTYLSVTFWGADGALGSRGPVNPLQAFEVYQRGRKGKGIPKKSRILCRNDSESLQTSTKDNKNKRNYSLFYEMHTFKAAALFFIKTNPKTEQIKLAGVRSSVGLMFLSSDWTLMSVSFHFLLFFLLLNVFLYSYRIKAKVRNLKKYIFLSNNSGMLCALNCRFWKQFPPKILDLFHENVDTKFPGSVRLVSLKSNHWDPKHAGVLVRRRVAAARL